MPLAFAQLLLEGDPGSTVEVGVLRFRKPEPQKLTLTRAMIEYPAVTAKMLPDQVGLIQVASLDGHNACKDVAAKVRRTAEAGRQATGSRSAPLRHRRSRSTASKLANLFLDKGLITYSEGQKVQRHDVTADPANDRTHLPLVGDRESRHGRWR